MDRAGKYIVVEGPDFSGKSNHCQLLEEWLTQEGYGVVSIREPGTGWFGEKIRSILLSPSSSLTPEAEMLLFMANRSQILEKFIIPNLEKGRIVLSSRDWLSSRSYQGYGRGLSLEVIEFIAKFAMKGLVPDLYLILIAPLETLMARMPGIPDRIEREESEFFKRVQQGYYDFISQARNSKPEIAVFDTSLPEETVHKQIIARVKQLLP